LPDGDMRVLVAKKGGLVLDKRVNSPVLRGGGNETEENETRNRGGVQLRRRGGGGEKTMEKKGEISKSSTCEEGDKKKTNKEMESSGKPPVRPRRGRSVLRESGEWSAGKKEGGLPLGQKKKEKTRGPKVQVPHNRGARRGVKKSTGECKKKTKCKL